MDNKKIGRFLSEVSEAFALADLENVPEMNYIEYENAFDDLTIGQIKSDLYEFYRFYMRIKKAADSCGAVTIENDINDDW